MREFGANLRLFEMILADVSRACSLNNDPNRTQRQGCIERGGQTLLVDSSMFGVVMVVMRKKEFMYIHCDGLEVVFKPPFGVAFQWHIINGRLLSDGDCVSRFMLR